ncbi:MAG: glycosyltransferase [Lutibacter sp.]
MKKLILFTASFPYGKKETYLETEIKYLAESFDSVIIFPHYYNNKDKSIREVPANVFVQEASIPISKFSRVLSSFKGLLYRPYRFYFIKEFFRKKIYTSRTNSFNWMITYLDYLATVSSNAFKKVEKESNATFYFYWGAGWAYALLDLSKNTENTYFLRLHGSDAYLERSNGYIPMRKKIFELVDYILPVSSHLSSYLIDQYNVESEKIRVSRLGTVFHGETKEEASPRLIKIISCANIIPLKRIDLIVDALQFLEGRKIHWIHFGDGPLMKTLLKKIESVSFKSIKIDIMGQKDNSKILSYYSNNRVDAFINVSKHEGLPVSIMEAMSFGIPCIATDAGATSEIVNNENGILLPNNFNIDELIDAISLVEGQQWINKKKYAYDLWNHMFNADKNYRNLAKLLLLEKKIRK